MNKRRIKMTIGVTYSSTPKNVDDLVLKIRALIKNSETLHSDFYLVNFDNFGPSSLDIFIYCFTKTTKWGAFLQAKQEFMLDLMKIVEGMGLDFAFPTSTVHLQTFPQDQQSLAKQRPE